jgi:hypothetical protein
MRRGDLPGRIATTFRKSTCLVMRPCGGMMWLSKLTRSFSL